MQVKVGNFKSFKLQHGTSIREFKDVEVRHPTYPKRDKDGNLLEKVELKDRWELHGTELKVEVNPGGVNRVVEVGATVGFLPESVVE